MAIGAGAFLILKGNDHSTALDTVQNFKDAIGARGSVSETLSTSNFAYPWNWAENTVGAANATGWLHELGDKAISAGHEVVWHGSGESAWVSIDGSSKTADVINVLRQFSNK